MVSQYNRGRSFEYRVKQLYEKHGWFVIRSAGSKGIADLVAIAPDGMEIHFIQCKKNGTISKQEKEILTATAYKYNALPILASRGKNGRGIALYLVSLNGKTELHELLHVEDNPKN